MKRINRERDRGVSTVGEIALAMFDRQLNGEVNVKMNMRYKRAERVSTGREIMDCRW
jgi:hypothetical protein